MEKQASNITREELEEFMEQLNDFKRKVEGIKSTIEILQDEKSMEMIKESEELEKKGIKPWKIEY